MAKPKKSKRARASKTLPSDIAKVVEAIHTAASRFLPEAAVKPQTVSLQTPPPGGMLMAEGKISTPIQPKYYVAVIIPVY
jgi:hypothetical protein